VLLSDEPTAAWLKQNFVLSWENVREPAKVTVDFGDGKVLRRTLAGNTAFYLTTSDGTVVDVFPGVYTPADFRRVLEPALETVREAEGLAGADRQRAVMESHLRGFYQSYEAESARISMSKMRVESPLLDAIVAAGPVPPVRPNVATTASKSMVESPLLSSLDLGSGKGRAAKETLDFGGFASRLEDISKQPLSANAVREKLALDPSLSEEERQREVIALDSKTNVRYVRPAVHLMFRDVVKGPMKPQDLTRVVFGQLLHINIDDPYLGLGGNLLPGTSGG
jgi:hypothetical protein